MAKEPLTPGPMIGKVIGPGGKEQTMERTPLEKAKACCGKHLHDRGTDRLLADIDAAPDDNEVWANREAAVFLVNVGVLGRELDTQFLALAFRRAILRGHMQGASSVLDKLAAPVGLNGDADTIRTESGKVGPSKVCNATDLGDGLGLEVPERFDEATGPMGCRVETDHDRHNDDEAQRAAQERADREAESNDNDE